MQQLVHGDTGRDVVVWQRFLISIWLADHGDMMHGVFDDATDAATRAFQTANGLHETGFVNRLTIEAAELQGLEMVDTSVSWLPTRATLVWCICVLCLTSMTLVSLIQAKPQIAAAGGQAILPMSPQWFPDSPPVKRCPDLFC